MRIATTILTAVLLGASVETVDAQAPMNPDSLVRVFIDRGTAGFFPNLLLEGCRTLAPWQNQTLERLLDADLSEERVAELATALSVALKCRDPRVEAWFIRTLEESLASEKHLAVSHLMSGLRGYQSPQVRELARRRMHDEALDPLRRENFGMLLFISIESPQEGRAELIRAMEAETLPDPVAISAVLRLLRQDASGTIDDMLDLAERDPDVVSQVAFRQLFLSARRYAGGAALDRLQIRLQVLAERPTLTPEQRRRIQESLLGLAPAPPR